MKEKVFGHSPRWGWHPERPEHEPGYTLFRRKISCKEEVPYHLAVSADNRFTFFLDGKVLGRGPLRGDLDNYYYDEYEGVLSPGEHIFAAEVVVWRSGWRCSCAPWSEIHAGGGFMAAGFAGEERMELPGQWLCSIDEGRLPLSWNRAWERTYAPPAPPMDEINFALYRSDWCTAEKPGGRWVTPRSVGYAVFRDRYQFDPDTPWNLVKRPLPQMEYSFSPVEKILEGASSLKISNGCLTGLIPAGKNKILIDLGKNQTSFVHISAASGKGSCRIAYSETLFDGQGFKTRSLPGTVGGKGYGDILLPAGAPWSWKSFWFRTARFIEITTDSSEDITELELSFEFASFPFGPFKEFSFPDDPMAEKMFAIGAQTLRCCSHEHFEDCPYYEQLQYIGDSRIEALLSYELSGNDALGRHALKTFGSSMLENGLIQSRYPSVFRQIIPGYCLIWILMLLDHWEYFRDRGLIRELLPKAELVLTAFERARETSGLIGPMPGWHYTDGVEDWPFSASDRGEKVPETILNLFFVCACDACIQLKKQLGEDTALWQERKDKTIAAVNAGCYDAKRKRYFDLPGHPDCLSMHANVLAVLAGAVPENERKEFLKDICADKELQPLSLYFSFYLFTALRRYGTREDFQALLGPWQKLIDAGCTTFPENWNARGARSDCHAWSASPLLFMIPDKNW